MHASVVLILTVAFYLLSISLLKKKNFISKVLLIALALRILSVYLYYVIFYAVTNTPFEVTFSDSLFYDDNGQDFAEVLRYGANGLQLFFTFGTNLDDMGYQIFLGTIYYFSGDSIIAARIIQAFVSTWSVYLAYKILRYVWGESMAREGALIYAGFHCFILYSTLHLREFMLVHLTLLMLLYFIKVYIDANWKNVLLLITSIILMFFFRTVFALAFIAAIGVFYTIFELRSAKNVFLGFFILTIMLAILAYVPFFESTWDKMLGYLGFGDQRGLGGYTQETVISRGMSLAKYIGGPVFILPSFVFPIPSLLKLNIEEFGRSMHWYFTGGLFVWVSMSFYFFRGFIDTIKEKNKLGIFIVILILIHVLILLQSFYFPSIRFSQVKMSLLILLVPAGFVKNASRPNLRFNFIVFLIAASAIIMGYNYLRIFGRM